MEKAWIPRTPYGLRSLIGSPRRFFVVQELELIMLEPSGVKNHIVFGFQIISGLSSLEIMEFRVLIAVYSICLSMFACSQKNTGSSASVSPSIYDAWEARYSYDIEDRRKITFHQGRKLGRSWGRDVKGKLDYSSFHSFNKADEEDLFFLHLNDLSRRRDQKWEISKNERIKFIQDQLDILDQEENTPFIEVVIEKEEDDDFVPPVLMPQGIDLNINDDAEIDDAGGLEEPAFPFAPLP